MTTHEKYTKDIKNVYKIVVGKCEGTVQFWRLILLKMLEETGNECVNWIRLALARESSGERCNESSGSIMDREFLE
jgi:hypothetical protein